MAPTATPPSAPARIPGLSNLTPPTIPDHTVVCRIGGGSYGEVWLARSVLGELRAVKVISRSRFNDERPFEREFEGIQRFEPISRSHPSQLAILHVGKNGDAGCFYYVMELADDAKVGQASSLSEADGNSDAKTGKMPVPLYTPHTLRHDLEQRGRLPIADCVQIGLSLTTALAHLHKHGLVHRDIKPSNVIFVNGVPKLGDIGLVTEARDTQSIVGIEGYIPPEGPGTPHADIYSLGKVLYEIGTGLDRRRFSELPEDLRTWPDRKAVVEFNGILLKACQKDPDRRYRGADEMQRDLTRLQRGRSLRRRRALEQTAEWAKRLAPVAALISIAAALPWPRFHDSAPHRFNAPTPASIFVLPFRNDGTNEVDEFLRSRVTDAIIDGLAQIDNVKVGPRKSGWVRRDENELRREINLQFGSRYALSGKVRASTNELAVTLTVHDSASEGVLWSDSFSGRLTERVELEERIIHRAAKRLGLKINADAGQRITQRLQNNLKALESYGEARRRQNERISAWATAAIEGLTHAIELDPNFVQAYTELAFTYRECRFKTWLLNLVRWRIRDQVRRRPKVGQSSCLSGAGGTPALPSDDTASTATIERVPDPVIPEFGAEWDTAWERNLFSQALERVRDRIDERQFQVFDLCVAKGWPPADVAQTLGISVARVYLTKHRVSALVKKEVQRLEKIAERSKRERATS